MRNSEVIKKTAEFADKSINQYKEAFDGGKKSLKNMKEILITFQESTPTHLSGDYITLFELLELSLNKVNLGFDLIKETEELNEKYRSGKEKLLDKIADKLDELNELVEEEKLLIDDFEVEVNKFDKKVKLANEEYKYGKSTDFGILRKI